MYARACARARASTHVRVARMPRRVVLRTARQIHAHGPPCWKGAGEQQHAVEGHAAAQVHNNRALCSCRNVCLLEDAREMPCGSTPLGHLCVYHLGQAFVSERLQVRKTPVARRRQAGILCEDGCADVTRRGCGARRGRSSAPRGGCLLHLRWRSAHLRPAADMCTGHTTPVTRRIFATLFLLKFYSPERRHGGENGLESKMAAPCRPPALWGKTSASSYSPTLCPHQFLCSVGRVHMVAHLV